MSVIDEIVAAYRRRAELEGLTPEHDDGQDRGQLATAAACYAYVGGMRDRDREVFSDWPPPLFPWELSQWKPTTPREDLINAVVMLIAEIERIDRASGLASIKEARHSDTVERIARMIDPVAFDEWQRCYEYSTTRGEPDETAREFAEWSKGKALEEARTKAAPIVAEIEAAIAEEREVCARLAETLPDQRGQSPEHLVGMRIAALIRSRAAGLASAKEESHDDVLDRIARSRG